MVPFHRFLPVALALMLAGLALGAGEGEGRSKHSGPPTLSDIARSPREFLGQELVLTIQVESRPTRWNPFLTRFGTEDYCALLAWGDEQRLWDREDYSNPRAMLFARRGTPLEPQIQSASRYGRFEATAVVRQVLLARPWIEITALRPLPEQFSEGSLIHASRGVEFMAAEHWELATQSFERALASDLPGRVRADLEGLRADSLARCPKPNRDPSKKIAVPVAPPALR